MRRRENETEIEESFVTGCKLWKARFREMSPWNSPHQMNLNKTGKPVVHLKNMKATKVRCDVAAFETISEVGLSQVKCQTSDLKAFQTPKVN